VKILKCLEKMGEIAGENSVVETGLEK